MAAQVKSYLRPTPGMLLLDGTAGGGGHTHLMLEAGAEVISLDQDPQALAECLKRLAHFGTKSRLVESNFSKAPAALLQIGEERLLNGALLDIGVSSHQLMPQKEDFPSCKMVHWT